MAHRMEKLTMVQTCDPAPLLALGARARSQAAWKSSAACGHACCCRTNRRHETKPSSSSRCTVLGTHSERPFEKPQRSCPLLSLGNHLPAPHISAVVHR